jgi:hypothetical protein
MYAFMVAKLSHEATALGLTQSEKYETRLKLRQNKGRFGGANQSRTGLNGFAGRGITALLSRHMGQNKLER